ncbi:hypothetical protein BU24DRAFT_423375 [Aaosphaeria arxii CBS 175.79]|uniref:MFS general substrate transporter n=1 Tax=Aaosphaeria arxii CBS 175.79 TaxID=1450172 RepID=A0A6A5XNE9_9PLEO|nr:uncharacterized protein BU24DRAFT_423375 [Aaosphaeria arxii CBS 175.79]KAF2014419.1 hypothetical protein BU24DRAFT_423375 [Aaosphaeria arxii CBS 175.79]
MVGPPSEQTNLLDNGENTDQNEAGSGSISRTTYLPPVLVLPLALLSALALSSTSATAYYTYATLLCKDATHCKGQETNRFAGYVAVATAISNILGIASLGPLQRITKTKLKLGLTFWITIRSMSPMMLFVGKNLQNIYVALSSKLFDGLASDNILHFALNTAYTQHPRAEKASSFIGYSLALYMVGISTSPFVAGWFTNSSISFVAAITLFALAAAYLQLIVHPKVVTIDDSENPRPDEEGPEVEQTSHATLKIFILPLQALARNHSTLFCGLSLLLYNVVQSYIFSALLIHTSIEFGFTSRENGFLISLVHSIGALYIFMSVYVMPKIYQMLSRESSQSAETKLENSTLAVLSFGCQALSLVALGSSSEAWQVYVAAALLALGLPTPSFVKAHGISGHIGSRRAEVLAALAMMETMGDVLGPVVLGGWQSYKTAGGEVFFLGSGLMIISLGLFVCNLFSVR